MKKVLVYVGLIAALMFVGKMTCYAAEAPAEMVEALNETLDGLKESGRYENVSLNINENDENEWVVVYAFDDEFLGVDYKLVLVVDEYGEVYSEVIEINAGYGWTLVHRDVDTDGLWYIW